MVHLMTVIQGYVVDSFDREVMVPLDQDIGEGRVACLHVGGAKGGTVSSFARNALESGYGPRPIALDSRWRRRIAAAIREHMGALPKGVGSAAAMIEVAEATRPRREALTALGHQLTKVYGRDHRPFDLVHHVSVSYAWLVLPWFGGRWLVWKRAVPARGTPGERGSRAAARGGLQVVSLEHAHNCTSTGIF